MINYYDEFELNPDMDSKAICEVLFKAKKVWSKRQNAADIDRRHEAECKVQLIDEVMNIFSDEEKRKAYDAELRQAAATQKQTQQVQQQVQYEQPDPNRSAYGSGYGSTSKGLKNNPWLTGIVCYLTFIGWLVAYFAGDREGAKVHLNSVIVLTILDAICTLAIKLGIFSAVFGLVRIAIFVFWIIGFIHALKGEEKELPVLGKIHIIK